MTHVKMKVLFDLLAECPVSSTLARRWLRSVDRGVRPTAREPVTPGEAASRLPATCRGDPPWPVALAVGLREVCNLSICNYQPVARHVDELVLSAVRGPLWEIVRAR